MTQAFHSEGGHYRGPISPAPRPILPTCHSRGFPSLLWRRPLGDAYVSSCCVTNDPNSVAQNSNTYWMSPTVSEGSEFGSSLAGGPSSQCLSGSVRLCLRLLLTEGPAPKMAQAHDWHWLWVRGLSSPHVGLTTGMFERAHDEAAGLPQSGSSKREQGEQHLLCLGLK